MKQLILDLSEPPLPSFGNFVTGRNAEAVAQLQRLAAGGGEPFIYLWGGQASGRTHLLRATVAAARTSIPTATYVPLGTAVPDPADGMACVAVDDVQGLSDDAQGRLFTLYNALRAGGGCLIAVGTLPPSQLPLRADVVTRLAWGLVYEVHALSDDEKAAALESHAAARGLRLPAEVIDYLLRHVRRDMPTLLAMLDALDRHSLSEKRAITLPLVRELLQTHPRDGGRLL